MSTQREKQKQEEGKISNKRLYELAISGFFVDKKLVVSAPASPEQEVGIAILSNK